VPDTELEEEREDVGDKVGVTNAVLLGEGDIEEVGLEDEVGGGESDGDGELLAVPPTDRVDVGDGVAEEETLRVVDALSLPDGVCDALSLPDGVRDALPLPD
jgi:hypothetical protein